MNRSYDVIVAEFSMLSQFQSSGWFASIMNVIVSVWFLYGVVVVLT